MEEVWVSSPDIFVGAGGQYVSVNRPWQAAMQFIEEFLIPIRDLVFDQARRAVEWRPHAGVLITPDKQFGEPCIEGTRIPTAAIWSFHQAGDTIDNLADAYKCTRGQIEDAIAWEEALDTNAA